MRKNFILAFCVFLSNYVMAETCLNEIKDIYDQFQCALYERFVSQLNSCSTNLQSTIDTIGDVHSEICAPLLLSNLDIHADKVDGVPPRFAVLPTRTGAGRLMAPDFMYSTPRALCKLTLPPSVLVSGYNASRPNGETWEKAMLFLHIGEKTHGRVFAQIALQNTACTNISFSCPVPQIPSTNLSNAAISKAYCSMESNLFSCLSFAITNMTDETVSIIENAGYIRSAKCRDLLLDNITATTNAPRENATVTQPPESCYPAVSALARIGMPFNRTLELIDAAEADSTRERLLVRLAELSHGFVFTNYVHSFGSGPTNRYSRIISEYGL